MIPCRQTATLCLLPLILALGLNGCDDPAALPNGTKSVAGGQGEGASAAPVSVQAPIRPELAESAELIMTGRSGPARIRLRRHLDQHANDAQALFLFGLSYHEEKKYTESRSWFEQAIEEDPEDWRAHHFLAWAAYQFGDLTTARTHFETHVAVQPEWADTHFGLGLIALDEGRLDNARESFTTAIELERDDPASRRHVAKAWARLGETELADDELAAAQTALETAVELEPNHYEAWNLLARVCRRLDLPERAAEAEAMFETKRDEADRARAARR